MILYISEEYGFRHWIAELSDHEYQELLKRWGTMRGLNCLVPVTLIVPQAKELPEDGSPIPKYDKKCHIHEEDDSYLDGSDYKIPEDESFWIDGVKYDF